MLKKTACNTIRTVGKGTWVRNVVNVHQASSRDPEHVDGLWHRDFMAHICWI